MEQPLVQILVVVANIQMRTLKTEVGKGSMWTAFGHGLADPKWQVRLRSLNESFAPCLEREWGYYSSAKAWIMCGNTNELGNVGESPGKRCLFFLTLVIPWNQIIWRYGLIFAKASCYTWCPERFQRPLKIRGKELFSPLLVPITASGPQGDQPLVNRTM